MKNESSREKAVARQFQEAVDVPLLNVCLVGVDVDGEVEVIGDGDGNGAGRGAWGLEDVEALDDEDVGAVHVECRCLERCRR